MSTFVPDFRTKVDTREMEREYGDIRIVQRMTRARRLGKDGKGYCYDHVKRVLTGRRRNESILALHKELVALRTSRH